MYKSFYLFFSKNFFSEFLYIAVLEKRTSHLSHKQKIVGSTPTTATKKVIHMKDKINLNKCIRIKCKDCKFYNKCFKEKNNVRSNNNFNNNIFGDTIKSSHPFPGIFTNFTRIHTQRPQNLYNLGRDGI